ncbi:MAG: prolyl oligopeptidase family serine peptidase [Lawsonibacter sp.]|nr:prolyl oligopeptidase family serine peptidase [Lawsonibacter sp.]
MDSRNIFLLGASQGGVVSAITAADNVDDVAEAVLLYPAFVLVDYTMEQYSSVDEVPESSFHLFMTVGKTYFEKLFDYDVYGHIQNYNKDILPIHGDRDGIVPLSYYQRALGVYPSAELEVIPGAGHGFHGDAAQQAIDKMSEYFSSHLNH